MFLTTTGLATAASLAVGGLLLAARPVGAASSFPAHFAAPYLQIDASDAGDMAADMAATGDRFYTLAFLIPQSGCTPEWEDNGDPLGAFTSQVRSLQAAGGNVIISFGGESGGELAQTCTSVSALTAAYASVVQTYGVTRLDFDIEGGTLGDSAANTLRDQALAALQAQDPSVQVDYTLPVAPNGLPSQEMGLLQDAKANGVKVSLVNIMTMDFGDGQNPLNDAISAAQATAGQLAGLYGISTSQAFGMMGLTPIAGQNDDNEFFSTSNASTLEGFAASNGVQMLSFWEVDQFDKPAGFAYSRIFNEITSGTGGGQARRQPPPPKPSPARSKSPSRTRSSSSRKQSPSSSRPRSLLRSAATTGGCAPAWSARTFYSPGDVVSRNGANWTSLWWSDGAEPGSSISWAVWTHGGSC